MRLLLLQNIIKFILLSFHQHIPNTTSHFFQYFTIVFPLNLLVKIFRTFSDCSIVKPCQTLCNPMDGNTQGFTVLHYFLGVFKLMSIELMMPSNHLILCRPLLTLPSIFPSIRVFSNKLAPHIRWPKYWNFIFSISPSNEYSGLISSRIGYPRQSQSPCLLAVQGTLKSLIQHHSSKASIFGAQPSLWSNSHMVGFPGGSDSKASACNVGDLGSIPGSRRSPGEGNGNPLHHSCLENPMDGKA